MKIITKILIVTAIWASTLTANAAVTLPVNGGTGLSTLTVGLCLKGNGTSPVVLGLCVGSSDWIKQTNYNVLSLTPSTTIPVWFKDQVFGSSSAIFAGSVTASNFVATTSTATSTFAGLVAIGTTTPQSKTPLWVTNTGARGQIVLEDTSGVPNQHYGEIGFSRGNFNISLVSDNFGTTSTLTIDKNRNVGIGTTSPVARLQVVATSTVSQVDIFAASVPIFRNSDGKYATTTTFRIDYHGAASIGSTSPSALFTVDQTGLPASFLTTLDVLQVFGQGSNGPGGNIVLKTGGSACGCPDTASVISLLTGDDSGGGGNSGNINLTTGFPLSNGFTGGIFLRTGSISDAFAGATPGKIQISPGSGNANTFFGTVTVTRPAPLLLAPDQYVSGGVARVSVGSSSPFGYFSVNPGEFGTGPEFVVGSSTRTHLIVANTTGRTGISSSTPFGLLSVNANNIGAVPQFVVGSSTGMNGATKGTNFVVNNNGNVGAGTTSPWAQLSVNPNNLAFPAFVIGSSTATKFVVTNGGNVGIATTSPFSSLSVQGVLGTMPFSVASSTTDNLFQVDQSGELKSGGGTPTVNTCGAVPNGSVNTGSDDTSGTVTVGAGVVTACNFVYSTPKKGVPHVFIQVDGVTGISSAVSASTATGFTVNFAATLGGGTFDYFVISSR